MKNKYNQSKVTRSPRDTLKLMILQRWDYVNNALELYYKQEAQGIAPFIAPVKSGVIALFNQIRPALQNDSQVDFNAIMIKVFSKTFLELEEGFNDMSEWLYSKGLLKFDELTLYDSTDTNEEDEAQGL